jgi:hypothetical protein
MGRERDFWIFGIKGWEIQLAISRKHTSWTKSKTVIQLVIFSFLRVFSKGIGGLLKKRSIFTVLLLVCGVFWVLACAYVRARAQNEQKTKKNEEK